ncbi:MAG: hypothetical protein AAFY54_13480 [Cyanobacteria bacterium J06648_10]
MHQLSPFTCRRLSQLPRLTSVWECDRRPLPSSSQPSSHQLGGQSIEDDADPQGDCIMWVDGLQGVVRGLSVVPPETGHEAIVRTLLQAIEMPQGRVEPARPRKVVVRDREIQFFLRGALQALDIPVEYASELPVIDDVFEKLQAPNVPQANLPAAFENTLIEKCALLWRAAPWNHLSEQEILAIELNCWEIETLYLSILGLAGMEYGLLFYRDLSSLQQFRHKLLHGNHSQEDMQQAFLEQNCLFINFNPEEQAQPLPLFKHSDQPASPKMSIGYEFGSLHPLEGLRSQLAEEEVASLIVVLEALNRFFKKHDISADNFALKPVTSRFRIPNPATELATEPAPKSPKDAGLRPQPAAPEQSHDSKSHGTEEADTIAVKISTVPEVSAAFLEETLQTDVPPTDNPSEVENAAIVDDSVPEGSLIMLGSHKEKDIEPLRTHRRIHYQSFLEQPEPITRPQNKSKWPILTIQTTRPKAKQLVERFRQEGGIRAICFNPGSDPLSGQVFQIGLIQTAKGQLHLFNEYEISDPTDSQALEKWATNSAGNGNCCGCIVAAGSTGTKRGRPTAREVVAFFEAQTKLPEELGLTPLVMSYAPDW